MHDAPLHAAPCGRHGVGAIRRADDNEVADALRVTLRESQAHHAAIGAAGKSSQRLEAQVIEQPQQHLGLVEAGDARKRLTRGRAGRVRAAAHVIEAQDAVAIGVEWALRADDLRPPALSWILGEADASMGRDAAQCTNDRRVGRSREAPRDVHSRQLAAMKQRDLTRDLENPFARDRRRRRDGGAAGRGIERSRSAFARNRFD